MPVLTANIRAFNLYMEPLKSPKLYFIATICIYILFSPEQGKHYTKLSQLFLSCFFLFARSANTLQHWFADEVEGQNRKIILGSPSFVFPAVWSVLAWVVGRYHKKGCGRFPLLYFCWISLPSLLFASEAHCGSNVTHSLSELLAFRLTHYRCDILTLSSPWASQIPHSLGVPQNSVLLEPCMCCTGTEQRGTLNTHLVCISSSHIYAPFSHCIPLSRHRYKEKIIKNFSDDTRALNQAWGPVWLTAQVLGHAARPEGLHNYSENQKTKERNGTNGQHWHQHADVALLALRLQKSEETVFFILLMDFQ